MTRWVAALSVVAMSAVALQARADVMPTEDGCGAGPGPICEEKTVTKCAEWKFEQFEIGGAGKAITIGYKITCAQWKTSTSTTYYSNA
jgi:hypothetical protein